MKAITFNGFNARTNVVVGNGNFEVSFRIIDGRYSNLDRRAFPVTGILMEDVLDKYEGMREHGILEDEAGIVDLGKVRRATFTHDGGTYSVTYFTSNGAVIDRTKKNGQGRRYYQSPVACIGGGTHAAVTRAFRAGLKDLAIEVKESKAKPEVKTPVFAG
jgi:hypothetical protein